MLGPSRHNRLSVGMFRGASSFITKKLWWQTTVGSGQSLTAMTGWWNLNQPIRRWLWTSLFGGLTSSLHGHWSLKSKIAGCRENGSDYLPSLTGSGDSPFYLASPRSCLTQPWNKSKHPIATVATVHGATSKSSRMSALSQFWGHQCLSTRGHSCWVGKS